MHYAEGSLMTLMAISLLMNIIKNGPVPFFIRPATNAIVGRVVSPFLAPNFKAHHTFLEDQLKDLSRSGPISVREGSDK
jgi:glutathione S-transferase